MLNRQFILVLTMISGMSATMLLQAASICPGNISETTPTAQFTINSNATVMDNKTGLVWMQCPLGQSLSGGVCSGNALTYTWEGALIAATSSSFGGNSDWRLPNIKELASIAEQACYAPAINEVVFSATPLNWFWSSSPAVENDPKAWTFDFNNGVDQMQIKDLSGYVRLVRLGQ
ncbi:MAG: DUF1566 domain-containing protein [Enterobacterales bacterium]|nr:DUF1566 domain-containing protein [Enterobacterales bacterium]